MVAYKITTNETWQNIPLTRVVGFLDPEEVYPFALTCSSSLAACKRFTGEMCLPYRSPGSWR